MGKYMHAYRKHKKVAVRIVFAYILLFLSIIQIGSICCIDGILNGI